MKKRVLCVCVGNISRSPMMQALLQQRLGADFEVESGGLSKDLAGRPANYRSIACMKERGVDLRRHISRWIGDMDLNQYRWIVTVGREEAERVRSFQNVVASNVIIANEQQGGIPDPYDLGMAGYQDCLALLDRVIPQVAKQIGDE